MGNLIIYYNNIHDFIINYLQLNKFYIINIKTDNKILNNLKNFNFYLKNKKNINNIDVLYKSNNKKYIILFDNTFLFSYKCIEKYNNTKSNNAFSTSDDDILLVYIDDNLCVDDNIINNIKMLSGPKGNFYKDLININYNKLIITDLIKKFPNNFSQKSIINIFMSNGDNVYIKI